MIGVEKTYGQVYEIGGADRLTYVEMLQQAAEVINGRRVPIVTVPVLTPRLSSLWIGLVTDVDTTTAGNLIDSMSTEVLQTDYSIQDIVPGEPLSYREAVERACSTRRTRADQKTSGSTNSIVSDQVQWVRIGPEDAAAGPALEADDQAEQQGREGQHHVAGGGRRDGVRHGRPEHRVPR